MIHLLEISPDLLPAQITKLARRYAMTGGYELALKPGLNAVELQVVAERFIPILKEYQPSTAEYRASNAYRVLALVYDHPLTDSKCRSVLATLL